MRKWNERWAKAVFLWLILLVTFPAYADRGPEGPTPFKPEELEALVAPIALYPDSVLSQTLMASTYPLEIVHAARWVKANPNVKGDAAVKAVENQPWDTSVKSLVAFPQILEPMNDKLDWTQKLGDAFLAQQKDVFAAVQRLRARAQESGNLKSNEQQKVEVEPAPAGGGTTTIVRIEPANPEVIYVPAYNPTVVYGGWSYPAYPPTYWPPYPAYYPGYYPGAALATGFAWGIGLAAAGAIFSDCNSCWGGGDVNINTDKAANINRNFDRSKVEGQGGRWQHDASHRQGVAYRDNATRDKFAGSSGADRRSQYRGRGTDSGTGFGASDRAGAGNRATAADRGSAGNRASVNDRSAGGNRAATEDRSAAANRGSASNRGGPGDMSRVSSGNRGGYGGGRDSSFSGIGGGGAATQRSYDRGRSSMQGSGFNRPSGGGMRGGGGGRGGGRR
ncbi:hypothetical protein P3T23_005552 [Paraburkholderia sp. GAS448]|uniref:DUF3300 domain-containing protein n=1 Tax=Paraburkholderia sp. GAS448 TaxID=3035136 RepID=UPI003D190465